MKIRYLYIGFFIIFIFLLFAIFIGNKKIIAPAMDLNTIEHSKAYIQQAEVIATSQSKLTPHHQYSATQSNALTTTPLTNQPLNSVINHLQPLETQYLIAAAKEFWATCNKQNNCKAQLKNLQHYVGTEKYILIKEYPRKISQFNNTLQDQITTPNQPLDQKLKAIKETYVSIWGDKAEQLFVDELKYYEQRLALDTLYRNSQYLHLEEKTQLFDQWIATQNNTVNPYKTAKMFFYNEIAARPELAFNIAEKYLTTQQAIKERTRLQRKYNQKKQAKNYQQALLDFKHHLEADRKTLPINHTETDWLGFKEEKIYKFRKEFFK